MHFTVWSYSFYGNDSFTNGKYQITTWIKYLIVTTHNKHAHSLESSDVIRRITQHRTSPPILVMFSYSIDQTDLDWTFAACMVTQDVLDLCKLWLIFYSEVDFWYCLQRNTSIWEMLSRWMMWNRRNWMTVRIECSRISRGVTEMSEGRLSITKEDRIGQSIPWLSECTVKRRAWSEPDVR